MEIDIKTLILILGITHLMQVLVFFYQYKANKTIKGPGWWLLWSALESLGFALIILRNIPSLLSFIIITQNIVLLAGTTSIYIGIQHFLNQKINYKLLLPFWTIFLFFHFYFIFINNNLNLRSLNISAALSLISFFTAFSIYQHKTKAIILTANFNAAIFIVHGCVFAYRAIMIGSGTEIIDIFLPTFFSFLPYFDALIVSLLWTFGFIMMMNQRLNSEIHEAKEHFELIFNTSPDSVVISRLHDGAFIDCNDSFTKITGYTKNDIAGNSSLSLNLWHNTEDRLKLTQLINKHGFSDNFETSFQKKNGEIATGLVSAKTLIINETTHLLSVIRDITDRKRIEEEIKTKNEELKKLNTEKDKFFSIIAHDLRSPFGSILGLTELLDEKINTMPLERIKHVAYNLRRSTTNLFRLLENLLEWSRMEQGLIPFNPKKYKLLPLIEESLITSKESALQKSISISYQIPEDFEIFTDSNIFQTVLRNLVSNAVKFTPRDGQINISAFSDENKPVVIVVKDSGIGISQKMIDNLFKLNVRTNRIGTDGEPSTGLGLILCKAFVEKHDGQLWVESEKEKVLLSTLHCPQRIIITK